MVQKSSAWAAMAACIAVCGGCGGGGSGTGGSGTTSTSASETSTSTASTTSGTTSTSGSGGTGTTSTGSGGTATGGTGGSTGGSGGTGPVIVCGDGIVDATEACDDGNTTSSDGCDALCEVEIGYTCTGAPSACVTTCGDGLVAGTEQCDDGGNADNDGCSALCVYEPGYVCPGGSPPCTPLCGDGLVVVGEGCDDGNTTAGDGCDALCKSESGWACTDAPSICTEICGDGMTVGAETCDDGGTADGDGCSATCDTELGYACTGMPSTCATVCGDGILAGTEICDDGDAMSGDGCSATCTVEAGFTCAPMPIGCKPVCGDGTVVSGETCDDANVMSGDGCSATCAIETGWACVNAPSLCSPICGDGMVVGAEICDDGNASNLDGCKINCTYATGESCAEPLAVAQATVNGAAYTWTIPGGSVVVTDGAFTCDPNTHGPDAVISYTKTSGDLAAGGKLLHVKADTSQTTTAYYLNVEVVAGACDAATPGPSLKCLWYKHDWDAYLDVPAGTYQIWVGKNSPATATVLFPATTVLVEEVPASAAEGEGCFAPYTSASANYTPPAGAGSPHTWTIPATINSFDMGPTWGEPGSISCDNTAPYGDIHGVDAVIRFDKQSASSVLKIDAQNLDPVLTQSALNLEVLDVCAPTSPAKISRHCRANKDTISITAPSPAGPVFIWASTEATGQEWNGASVQVTEIFPAPGETWPTAQPLTGSGPIAPTSTVRLDAPSCFPAASNIHWYSYTLTNNAISLGANAAGTIGVYDAHGQEKTCLSDAATAPIGLVGTPGETFYIAVASPSPIGSLTILDVAYTGIKGKVTDMLFTFPTSPVSEFGMTVGGGQLFMGDTSSVFAIPLQVGADAVEHGTGDGLTTTHFGYDLVFAGGSIFSVDSTTVTNVSRLFRIYDGATWGPTTWDLNPVYGASQPSHGIGTDGVNLFMTTRDTASPYVTSFYSFSTSAAAPPTLLGTNSSVYYVVGLAADTQYFYVASNGPSGEGVYRLSRASLSAAPVKIATVDTGTLCTNIEIDSYSSPQHLYVRSAVGDVHAVIGPASATPVHIGAISTLGTSSDYAMTFDKGSGVIYLFETETDSAGRIVKLE